MPNLSSYRGLETDEASPYICPLCGYLIKDPVQTVRGYLACQDCYIPALVMNNGICPIDSEPISRSEIFRDIAREKEILNLKCYCINKDKGCQWYGTIRALKEHDCEYEAIRGPMCDEKLMQKELFKHQTSECQSLSKVQKCRYNAVGCSFEANSFEEMMDHVAKNEEAHNDLLNVNKMHQTLNDKLVKKQNQNMRQAVEKMENTISSIMENTWRQIAQLKEDLAALQNVQREQRCTVGDENIDAMNYAIYTMTIPKVDLRLQLHDNSIYDGDLIWKVDNFQDRRSETISGLINHLRSAPCFTGKYGYKFCLRLYLNGDGMGLNTHLSLFLVIMKSEYDNILEWPFTKKVKFTLINQQNRNNDIVERIIPNKDSLSFQKPRKEMNIASGIPLFVEIARLDREGFVKGDSLFIDVQIM